MGLPSVVVATVSLLVLGSAACSRNRDQEAKALIDDLAVLDEAVIDAVRAHPDADGLAKAEALVEAKRASLHDRVVKLEGSELSPDVMKSLPDAYGKNAQSAKVVTEHVQNAVLKTNPELIDRARKLALGL
ncbi:MAG: hypothetical protein ABI175_13220, partial [Polyangiales bacterium]